MQGQDWSPWQSEVALERTRCSLYRKGGGAVQRLTELLYGGEQPLQKRRFFRVWCVHVFARFAVVGGSAHSYDATTATRTDECGIRK
jgi:hypothetical protein